MEKSKNKKVQFVVVREFSGDKTMQEAFEQVIERQTCEQFEKWLENHETEQKAVSAGSAQPIWVGKKQPI